MSPETKHDILELLKKEFTKSYLNLGGQAFSELTDINNKEKLCLQITDTIGKKYKNTNKEALIDYTLDNYFTILSQVHNNYESEKYIRLQNQNASNQDNKQNNKTHSSLLNTIIFILNMLWKIIKGILFAFIYVAYFIISLIFGLSKKYK